MSTVTLNKLSNVINKVKWTRTNDFIVRLQPINDQFRQLIKWGDILETQTSIDIALKSVNIPQYSGAFEELLVAGVWHFARDADPVYQTELTFRDFNGASLYRRFVNAFQVSKNNYSDVCAFLLEIYLPNGKGENIQIAKIGDAQISDVSQLTLSQETTEILEFNVSFKSNQPTHSNDDIPTNINLSSNKAYSNEYKNAGSNFFSNLLKNGLSAAQNAVVDTFDNLLNSWK